MTPLRKIQLGILIAAAVSALVALTSCGTDRAIDCFNGCNPSVSPEPTEPAVPDVTCTATEMELVIRVECTTGLILVVDKPVVEKIVPADVTISPSSTPAPPPACTVIDSPEPKEKKKHKERRHE
jgi:hypothetical protein